MIILSKYYQVFYSGVNGGLRKPVQIGESLYSAFTIVAIVPKTKPYIANPKPQF